MLPMGPYVQHFRLYMVLTPPYTVIHVFLEGHIIQICFFSSKAQPFLFLVQGLITSSSLLLLIRTWRFPWHHKGPFLMKCHTSLISSEVLMWTLVATFICPIGNLDITWQPNFSTKLLWCSHRLLSQPSQIRIQGNLSL